MKTWQDKNSPLYTGLPFMAIRGTEPMFPCIAEVKFDGEFQYVIKSNGEVYLANKQEHGRIRMEMPITQVDYPDNSVFLGELVYGAGKNFYDFARHKLDADLNLVIFDCLRHDGLELWNAYPYVQRRGLIQGLTFYNEKVFLAPVHICHTQEELDAYYETVIAQGFEGIVIKDPHSLYVDGDSANWVKRKFTADAEFVIMGFKSGTAKVKTLSVLVGHRVDGEIQRLTYVGGGFGANTVPKETMLEVLKTIVTGKTGDEYHVEPKIVVTVEHYGVIRNPDGSVSSLRHPQFKCVRYDKTVGQIDTIK